MTTDNKALAVDVLTAMSVAERVLILSYEGYEQVIFELASSRAAVAELIDALRACDRRLHDLGFTVSDDVTAQVIHALARVKGESA